MSTWLWVDFEDTNSGSCGWVTGALLININPSLHAFNFSEVLFVVLLICCGFGVVTKKSLSVQFLEAFSVFF